MQESQSSTGNNYSPFLHPRGICRFQLFSGVHAFTQLLRNANKQTNLHLENSSSAPVLPETKRHCYGPNVLVFSQSSYAKIPTLKDAGSRRWGLTHEAGAPMNGISASKREIPSPLPHVWTQWEVSDLRGASLDPAGTWSQTSSLHNCEKEISTVYKPPSQWYFATAAWTDSDGCYSKDQVHVRIVLFPEGVE